ERKVSREEAETLAETYGLNFAEYNIGSKDDRKCDIILSQLIRSIKSFELGKKNQPTSGHLNVFEIVFTFLSFSPKAFLGDCFVGKTSFITKILTNSFKEAYQSTSGT